MTTTLVTLTGDVTDAIGSDFDPRRTKAYVKHNTDKIVTDSGPIHLGGGTVNVEADGTFTLPNVVAATSLVTNLQATVYVDYADPATRQRATATFGPYDLSAQTGTVDIRTLESVQALDASAASVLMSEMQALRDETAAIAGLPSEAAAQAYNIEHDATVRAALSASFVGNGEVVLHADRYASLQAALDDATGVALGVTRRVLAPSTYTVTTTLTIGNDTILDGAGTGRIEKASASAFKMLLNRDAATTGNSNIIVRDLTIQGDGAGSEFSAGIHFSKVTDGLIHNVTIQDVKGDGITLGNIVGATIQTTERVTVSNCRIDGAGRQGIALTDAKACNILNNHIANCAAGGGVDLEPDFAGQFMSDILVQGNTITNCSSGIVASSVDNMSGTSQRNRILDNSITDITNQGIQNGYSNAVIRGNVLDGIGREGIKIVSSVGVSGQIVQGNHIVNASQAADNTYPAIGISDCVHSIFTGNVFVATAANKVSKLWDETGTSGYNSFVGNNGRQIAKAYTRAATSNASHNLLNSAAVENRHEGFFAMGNVDMNGNAINFTERPDPAAPAANNALVYAKDDGAGHTQLVARFNTGAVQVIARDDAAASAAPIPLTLTAPWVDFGSGYGGAAYYKDAAGFVHLMGAIKSGTVGQDIATLPVGFRPTRGHMMGPRTQDGTTTSRIDVMTSGVIAYQAGGATAVAFLTLDGISFYAG